MKDSGYHVVVIGASSLMGKELLTVLEEGGFPISSLRSVEDEWAEPELPFLDLDQGAQETLGRLAEIPDDFDFAFVAAPTERLGGWLERLRSNPEESPNLRTVIDLSSRTREGWSPDLRVPFLDRQPPADQNPPASHEPRVVVSPHAATIMISALMGRIAARFPIRNAVAQLYSPASEIGSRAIDELQKQTVNLLSFQKVPQEVFGGQIAFNLLPRLGTAAEQADPLEGRIRSQLQAYLGGRVRLPALRLLQVPVFYSLALSLYMETEERVAPADLVAALDGRPLRICRGSQKPPSQVEAAGSNEILVDAIEPDAACPEGVWLWAAADNLRLAALNAAQIAESLILRRQPLNLLR
jgi:aspartate-semialdehyde dehydrogenase